MIMGCTTMQFVINRKIHKMLQPKTIMLKLYAIIHNMKNITVYKKNVLGPFSGVPLEYSIVGCAS